MQVCVSDEGVEECDHWKVDGQVLGGVLRCAGVIGCVLVCCVVLDDVCDHQIGVS